MLIGETRPALTINSETHQPQHHSPPSTSDTNRDKLLIYLGAIQRRTAYALLSTSHFTAFSLGHEGWARTQADGKAAWHFTNLACDSSL
jgi:hypothetical protein